MSEQHRLVTGICKFISNARSDVRIASATRSAYIPPFRSLHRYAVQVCILFLVDSPRSSLTLLLLLVFQHSHSTRTLEPSPHDHNKTSSTSRISVHLEYMFWHLTHCALAFTLKGRFIGIKYRGRRNTEGLLSSDALHILSQRALEYSIASTALQQRYN